MLIAVQGWFPPSCSYWVLDVLQKVKDSSRGVVLDSFLQVITLKRKKMKVGNICMLRSYKDTKHYLIRIRLDCKYSPICANKFNTIRGAFGCMKK